jgi:hypothetical protein
VSVVSLQAGDRVKVGANDAKVAAGSIGRFVRIVEESGCLLVDVDDRGRVAFTAESVTHLDGTPVKVMALAPAEPVGRPAGNGGGDLERLLTPSKAKPRAVGKVPGISRELYLTATDTAEELGLSQANLHLLADQLGMKRGKRGIGRTRTFTASELIRLRQVMDATRSMNMPATRLAKLLDPDVAAKMVALITALHGKDAPFLQLTGSTAVRCQSPQKS